MKSFLIYSFLLIVLVGCIVSINRQDLVGKWNYISYEYQNKSLNKTLANIALQKPSIVFNKDGSALIYSSGKVLSSGTYQLDGKIIRYVEVLQNGQKRNIPFLINELNNDELIFQTMDAEVKIITSKREKSK